MRVKGRGPSRGGWRLLCVSAWARINVHARAVQLRMQDRPGKGQDMSAHWVSGSFTRCDHFTLPPEAFFPPKAFSCSWLNTCWECNRERKGWIISTYNSPQNYYRTKEKRERKRGERGGGSRINFLFLSPFSPSIASPCPSQGTWTRGPRVLHCGWSEQVGSHVSSFI